jgi:hypothetical protein
MKFIKSFFYSKGKPSPIYFWATAFLLLTFLYIGTEVVKCLIGDSVFSNIMLVQLVGLVSSLIIIYNLKTNADANRASITSDKNLERVLTKKEDQIYDPPKQ